MKKDALGLNKENINNKDNELIVKKIIIWN